MLKIVVSSFFKFAAKFMYMKCCVFVCEDFPKENQKLANKATNIGKAKTSNFLYTLL